MQIFRSLAGYSYGRADVVRRAMSKKKHDVMEQERTTFVDGCAKNGISPQVANSIFDKMTDFASYAFNKSHAACYALVAYRCAYLKCYFPSEFMAALLTSVLDSSNKVARYIAEAKRLGIRPAPPNINSSMKGFTADGRVINYGLLGIKNLGNEFINEIIAERKNGDFVDLFDFCSRMQSGHFNRRAVESLIKCGAMDCFGANRRSMLQALPVLVTNLEQQYRKTMYGQVGFFDISDDFGSFEMPNVDEFTKNELLLMEKEMTGLFLSGHPMDRFEEYVKRAKCTNILELDENKKDGDRVIVCGIINHITIKRTRSTGANMAFVTIEDLYGAVEVVLFPKVLVQYADLIVEGNVIAVAGNVSKEDDKEPKILANAIYPPTAIPEQSSSKKQSRKGLFLKLASADDLLVEQCRAIMSQNKGSTTVYFYYEDTKKYYMCGASDFVDCNQNMMAQLRNILGDKNVVLVE